MKKSFRLLLPLLLALGVYQLNVMLARVFASFLETGAQSYLYYSQRIVEIPQGVFGFAIAAATLPTLSELKNLGDTQKLNQTFAYGLRLALFIAIPSTVALILMAEPIATVLLARGPFDTASVDATAATLRLQATGVWAVATVRTSVPMFHAYNDTKSPVIAAGINLCVFVTLSLLLLTPMAYEGIALANAAAAVAQLFTLLWLLRRKTGRLGLSNVARSGARMLLASIVMGAVCFFMVSLVDWTAGGNDLTVIGMFIATTLAGMATYAAMARLLRIDELETITKALRRRLGPR